MRNEIKIPFFNYQSLFKEHEENFIEIFIDCPLHVCEKRDVKGLYAKARKGLIPNFTGIDAPFENPKQPDLTVNTETDPPELSLKKLLDFIEPKLKLE